jgi:divinyl protochlorophyllide a 8-vinyl-reductase
MREPLLMRAIGASDAAPVANRPPAAAPTAQLPPHLPGHLPALVPADAAVRGTAGHGGSDGDMPRIGPNAITRVAEALHAQLGDAAADAVFATAGLSGYRQRPPEAMVDERHVIALHRALRASLDADTTGAIARDAGWRTGDYLLAHRIPRPVQMVLKVLPAGWASRILLAAIGRHAWTFAGSGVFTAHGGHPSRFSIAGCPLCRDSRSTRMSPSCAYYAATFERLFRELVARDARVTEIACEATGASACTFEARW